MRGEELVALVLLVNHSAVPALFRIRQRHRGFLGRMAANGKVGGTGWQVATAEHNGRQRVSAGQLAEWLDPRDAFAGAINWRLACNLYLRPIRLPLTLASVIYSP